MNKRVVLNLIGIFFVFLGVIALINTFSLGNYYGVLWFCYFALILIGIAILSNSPKFLLAQVNILTIPLIVWTIDFIYVLSTGNSFLGITDYFFSSEYLLSKLITLQHLFTIPLSLFAIWLMKRDKKSSWKSWQISFIEIALIFLITRIFTSYESNINCVYHFCGNIEIPFYYPVAWFVLFFAMVLATDFLVRVIIKKRKQDITKIF